METVFFFFFKLILIFEQQNDINLSSYHTNETYLTTLCTEFAAPQMTG